MGVRRSLETLAGRLGPGGRPIILMYHRVARVTRDPWGLAVSPERFAEQIEVLVQRRRVVPLSMLGEALARGQALRDTAALTFDDGYADVLTGATPVLEHYCAPATVFLTTGAIGRDGEFWWDELSRIVLESSAPLAELDVAIGGQRYSLDDLVATGGRIAGQLGVDHARTTHERLHLALWWLLRPLGLPERRRALDALVAWAGSASPPATARALTVAEARALAGSPCIEIGAHAVSHPSLPLLDAEDKRREVRESKAWCETLTGAPIAAFAYPHGDVDAESAATVRDAGFAFACGTDPAAVTRRTDPMRLPRYGVGDWDATEFARWLPR